ncbi:unnamed protein product [Rotaria socialis]|nr:unnamed protein product [Rotaria socialis]
MGFGETHLGTVPSSEMVDGLIDFLLDNGEGFNLVLFLHDNDRIDAAVVNTYHVLATIIKSQVPQVFIITKDTAQAGTPIPKETLAIWGEEKCCFCDGGRVSYPNIDLMDEQKISGKRLGRLKDDINESNELVKGLIVKHALKQAIPICNKGDLLQVLRVVWNAMATIFKWPSLISTSKSLIQFFVGFGLTPEQATVKAVYIESKLFFRSHR